MELLQKDIRETGWRIEIGTGGKNLKLSKFQVNKNSLPVYDTAGFLLEQNTIEYAFQQSSNPSDIGVLTRNGKIILKALNDLTFNLRKVTVNNIVIPSVEFELVYGTSKETLTRYEGHVVPRHLASWARHQFWASVSNGQRTKYKFK